MRKRLALLGALLLMCCAPASADPFVLRAPSSLDFDFESNGFGFFADGFSAVQRFPVPFGLSFGHVPGCDPCSVGQVYNPSFTATDTFMGQSSVTIGDTSYSDVSLFGDLSFIATPLAFPVTDADGIGIRTPFTFTGTLRGFQGDQLAFTVGLTGAGLTSRFFDYNGNGTFAAGENRFTYFFTDPPGAVPEPASLLLLGTGIAGLVARQRLKRGSPFR